MASADFPWRSAVTPGIRAEPDPHPDAPPDPSQSDPSQSAAGVESEGAGSPDRAADVAAVADAEQYRSLLTAAAQVLDRVDRALGQLADGTYGRCSECGAPIDHRVLERDPMSDRCAAHAPQGSP